ncbi:MAG TPA: CinA family nicotinamide mononucleotide deamidase-related protein [Opitutaceae bacterium]|nr:CinA family nicotinamide mononucleotide deamidase-related protein [Opitutaceae bacterium]
MAKKTAPAARTAPKRFELLTLGNELLLGRTPNAHLAFIGDQLARRGVELAAAVVVPDDAHAIATAFARSWARASVVITTGGLGPTSDDVTREALAEALGQKLVFDKAVEKTIAARFATLGRKMTANNLKQAWRPEGAEVIANPFGTAPGLLVEQDGKVLIMLPGPPNELEPMWRNEVLPRLARRKLLGRTESFVQLRTAGVGESALETRLQPLLAKHPGVEIAYCAHAWAVDVRFGWGDGAATEAEARQLADEALALLGDDVFAVGNDSLAEAVADLLRQEEKTLAVAESGSGGQLASVFTDLPGASKFFQGGVVVYRNAGKVILLDIPEALLSQHGAISAEAAVAMASGVSEKLVADYGLSIACCAGPGACCDGKAAGSTFVGLHAPDGVWCRRLDYPGTATAVRARSINSALDWLRRELLQARRARLAVTAVKATPVKAAIGKAAKGKTLRAAKAK